MQSAEIRIAVDVATADEAPVVIVETEPILLVTEEISRVEARIALACASVRCDLRDSPSCPRTRCRLHRRCVATRP
jgi:hypothetical protein